MVTISSLVGNVPQIRPARRIARDDGYLHRRLNSAVFIPSGRGALIPLHINCLSLCSPTRHFLWGERCLLEAGASGSGLHRNTDAREQCISILVEPVIKALFAGKHSCICSSFSRNQIRHRPSTSPSIAFNDRTSFCLSKPRLDNAAHTISNPVTSQRNIACSTLQESSTSTVAEDTNEVNTAPKAAPGKPKVPAKAPAKPLPQMMEEDVIPPLKAILETQDELSDIELSFQDNKLEGSFLKKGNPYIFWAFFPNGVLTGPKGFSLSSYGSGASTVEPFLIDEKKITANLIVFWIEKRLAAQGIIPVWKD